MTSEALAPVREATAPIPVLYVGGMPRSGSTLTDLLLDHLPGHFGVGEMFYLWRNCLIHDDLCACGERFSRCDFWQRVGVEAFGNWGNVDPDEVMRLQGVVDKSSVIPFLLATRRPPAFQSSLDAYADVLTKLYRGVAKVSGASVIVDSSKRPSLAFILRLMTSIELRVVHVVRDPRGVAYSFAKHVPLGAGVAVATEMPRSTARKVSRRWVTVNAMVALLARIGVPLVRIRYEDLITSPRSQLERVLALEAIGATPSTFDFITPDGVVLRRTHTVASGRIRLSSGAVELRIDDAWRHSMPARDRRLVSTVTALTRRKYGYS